MSHWNEGRPIGIHWNEGRPIGIHLYDLDSLTRDFGKKRVKEFLKAAETDNVLKAHYIETAAGTVRVLSWTHGTPNMTSYQTLREEWENLKPKKRARLNEVLDDLGQHQIEGWFIA